MTDFFLENEMHISHSVTYRIGDSIVRSLDYKKICVWKEGMRYCLHKLILNKKGFRMIWNVVIH